MMSLSFGGWKVMLVWVDEAEGQGLQGWQAGVGNGLRRTVCMLPVEAGVRSVRGARRATSSYVTCNMPALVMADEGKQAAYAVRNARAATSANVQLAIRTCPVSSTITCLACTYLPVCMHVHPP